MEISLGNVIQKSHCPTVEKHGGIIIKELFIGNELVLDITITSAFLRRYKENNYILECEEDLKKVIIKELERRSSNDIKR
jgi:hypothetical protein